MALASSLRLSTVTPCRCGHAVEVVIVGDDGVAVFAGQRHQFLIHLADARGVHVG